ncbi:hypothetical protein [Sphingomonas oryzagri]|uniref:HTH luxR-type domain-containing protein n=1 Tax=Sphingomonas oryzagri TaxID=3042314 RepID=A0ABT6N1Q1_9SPHN|nr:hypothetical protein [Sphingomonas oryzagri]MDH7639219.1 hypothetical protein [Sphingomonas oryzagri]
MDLPFHLLTDSERECLRLVHQGHSSKAIAARRSVRSDRIDKIINSARAKLGGLPRRVAARLLVEFEARNEQAVPAASDAIEPLTQSLGAHRLGVYPGLPNPADTVPATPSREMANDRADTDRRHEPDRSSFAQTLSSLILQAGLVGSGRNDVARMPSMAMIAFIAAAAACTVGAALSLLFVLDHIAAGH